MVNAGVNAGDLRRPGQLRPAGTPWQARAGRPSPRQRWGGRRRARDRFRALRLDCARL